MELEYPKIVSKRNYSKIKEFSVNCELEREAVPKNGGHLYAAGIAGRGNKKYAYIYKREEVAGFASQLEKIEGIFENLIQDIELDIDRIRCGELYLSFYLPEELFFLKDKIHLARRFDLNNLTKPTEDKIISLLNKRLDDSKFVRSLQEKIPVEDDKELRIEIKIILWGEPEDAT